MSNSPALQRRVLLVDDEPKLLAGLRRALHDSPLQLFTANSGAEALTSLERQPVDAIISDQDMPGMTGVELLSKASRLYPETVRFMLTGKATLDLAIEAINQGSIHRFFTKPIEASTLVTQLSEALAQKTLVDEAWRLVMRMREQNAFIVRLEQETPDVLRIWQETEGPHVLEEPPESLEQLLAEIERTLEGGGQVPRLAGQEPEIS